MSLRKALVDAAELEETDQWGHQLYMPAMTRISDPLCMKHFRDMPIVIIYMGYLLIAAVHPFEVYPDFSGTLSRLMGFLTLLPRGNDRFNPTASVQKLLLFVPLGILLYYGLRSQGRSKVRTMLLVIAWGGLFSLLVELCQLISPHRHASAFDVFVKAFGAMSGAFLSAFCPIQVTDQAYRFWGKLERFNVPLAIIILYGALPGIFFVARFPWLDFRNWDPRFTLQIANEVTLDKPWLGKIYLIAIYDRALSPDEIARHLHLGFSPEALTRRVQEGLIAFYTFDEASGDTIHDTSTSDPPVDLISSPGSHIRWLHASNGIEILQPTIIMSQGPAKKLITALGDSCSFSIEAWISPANTTQIGPARIISFSGGINKDNFLLGQQGENINFRLRTSISGRDGTPINLVTRDRPLTPGLAHIVGTYRNGRGELYVNGGERSGGLDLTTDVIVGFGTRKNPLAQIAYSFFYFFPASFFLAIFFSTRSKGVAIVLFLPMAIAAGLLSITEIFQAFAFDRAIDLPVICYGIFIGTVGAFSGVIVAKRR